MPKTEEGPSLESRPLRRRRRESQPSEPMSIASLMIPTLSRLGMRSRARQAQMEVIWPQVVGEGVATETSIHSFARGRLGVETSSSALSHQLHLQRQTIIDGLNRVAGEEVVSDIRFRLREAQPPVAS